MATGGSSATNPRAGAFPADIRFRKPWRGYQQRVLAELEQYLDDHHLHVIAAPGSGKTALGWLMRKDYHAVPQSRGKNKDVAEHFRRMWARYVGPTELVYTRTPEGRRFLLRARTNSMSQSFQRRAERLRCWQ
jgi:hypothetical protein